MKTVGIREAQHNLAKILHEVEQGTSFQVMRRKVPVARLVPIFAEGKEGTKVDWSGHAARMAGIWPEGPREVVDAVLDDLRGSR
jgi:antitoxin (DNA-binding transcriptional repressor) of toxin-antitoxin stability system